MTTTPLPLRLLGNTALAALILMIGGAVAFALLKMAVGMAEVMGTAWVGVVVLLFGMALAIGLAVTWAERRG